MCTPPNLEKVELDYCCVKKDTKHFLRCLNHAVRKLKIYWNKWITPDESSIDILNDCYKLPPDLNFNPNKLTRAIGRDPKFNAINIIKDT